MKILKFIKWMIKSIVIGLATLFLFNIIGVKLNLNIPINLYTILVVGTLRLPGLAMILIQQKQILKFMLWQRKDLIKALTMFCSLMII